MLAREGKISLVQGALLVGAFSVTNCKFNSLPEFFSIFTRKFAGAMIMVNICTYRATKSFQHFIGSVGADGFQVRKAISQFFFWCPSVLKMGGQRERVSNATKCFIKSAHPCLSLSLCNINKVHVISKTIKSGGCHVY